MTTQSDVLRDMSNNADTEAEEIDAQIEQLDVSIDEYNEKIDGVQNGVCAVAEDDLVGYLDGTKLTELEILLGQSLAIVYGSEFGTIDYETGGLTDFTIIDTTTSIVVYEYEGVGWDSDAKITKLVEDYAFSNDYLTRPLDSGATYGLIPNRNSLLDAKSILQNNKQKAQDSKTGFADYAS